MKRILSIAAVLGSACAQADTPAIDAAAFGSWRFVAARSAPWAADGPPGTELMGARVAFGATEIVAPAPMGCANATYEFVVMTAEGFFQGGLPAPADSIARALGMRVPALTIQVTCDTGVFDYHHIDGDTLLLALDNVVWTLAPEADESPATIVRRLLAAHMSGDMAFTPEAVATKRAYLAASLADSIAAWFAVPWPTDEPPPINGDPFTDSQEYPDRFRFDGVEVAGDRATVRVAFSDGTRTRPVEFILLREGSEWVVDDLRYEDGSTFREMLPAT